MQKTKPRKIEVLLLNIYWCVLRGNDVPIHRDFRLD